MKVSRVTIWPTDGDAGRVAQELERVSVDHVELSGGSGSFPPCAVRFYVRASSRPGSVRIGLDRLLGADWVERLQVDDWESASLYLHQLERAD